MTWLIFFLILLNCKTIIDTSQQSSLLFKKNSFFQSNINSPQLSYWTSVCQKTCFVLSLSLKVIKITPANHKARKPSVNPTIPLSPLWFEPHGNHDNTRG